MNVDALAARLTARPVLSRDVRRQTRLVRGEAWVFLQNRLTGGLLRLRLEAWQALAGLDGRTRLRDWLEAHHHTPHAGHAQQRLQWLQALDRQGMLDWREASATASMQPYGSRGPGLNPLGFRVRLGDPGRVLERLLECLSPHAWARLCVVLAALGMLALLLGVAHGDELAQAWRELVDTPTHWWYYLVLFPLMKAVHEAAHALVLMRHGGEVRDAGIAFLVLMPLPYVDASDACLLPSRRQRMLVSAAGMLAELAIAAIALLVWLAVEPGSVQDIAFALFVLGTVSTLVFNANPLLRFDGYYLLEDLLDMPGLANRSIAWYRHGLRRYLLGVRPAVAPPLARREWLWLLGYGGASTVYRVLIAVVIAGWLVDRLHEIGLLLALLIAWQMLLRPAARLVRYLATAEELRERRLAGLLRGMGAALVVFGVVGLLPLPSSTRVEGIVWVPRQAELRVDEAARLDAWLVEEGDWVLPGTPIAHLASPPLQKEARELGAARQGAEIALQAALVGDIAGIPAAREALAAIDTRLAHVASRQAALTVTATTRGRVVFGDEARAPGRHLQRGEVLAWLIDPDQLVVRTVIEQHQLGLLQHGIEHVSVRLANAPGEILAAHLQRQVPTADHALPSEALADNGLGGIAVTREGDSLRTRERVFHVELALPPGGHAPAIGGRAYVSLTHASESLGHRWWRQSRQLLLKHLTA